MKLLLLLLVDLYIAEYKWIYYRRFIKTKEDTRERTHF